MAIDLQKELEEFNIISPPDTFIDGFNWKSLVGAIFIGLLMVPGALYMRLVAGLTVGGAAQWVTVILFLEIARRTHKSLNRAELFVLFYMALAATAMPFEGLLYRQFVVQSKAFYAMGWQDQIPWWYAPTDPKVLGQRNFFMWEWAAPIGMIMLFNVISRLDSRVIGFGLFRLTSDYEKLPFPMAPVGAQGISALAEADVEDSWRWRAFSIGGAIGLTFGAIYIGLPIISNALLGVTMQALPIPFADWTGSTESFLPAVATGYSFDLTHFLLGMVLPWWSIVGSFIALVTTWVLNPVFYSAGILNQWRPGDGTIITLFKNLVDFYFSFVLGLSIATALVGIYSIIASVRRAQAAAHDRQEAFGVPAGRGGIPNWTLLGLYTVTSSTYILISGSLVDWHRGVMLVLCIYAYLYTPLVSYVTARLEGIAGEALNLPLAREVGFILSGYSGLKIWFLPIPLSEYGGTTSFYRQAELTGTKFWSIWKADLFLVPFILVCSVVFANFIWSMAPVPSEAYPFAQKLWEFNAMTQALVYSSTVGESQFSQFRQALNGWIIGAGGLIGLVGYAMLSVLGLPLMLYYGYVRGLNPALPHAALPMFLGGCLGRFYFHRKWGKMWRQYVPVIFAGFGCGMGLVSMMCIGFTFLRRAIFNLMY